MLIFSRKPKKTRSSTKSKSRPKIKAPKKSKKQKKFILSKKQCNQLRYQRYHHPDPKVQKKCDAVLLLSFLFCAPLVGLIIGISAATVRNYWNTYHKGGLKALKKTNYKGQPSKLHDYKDSIEEDFNDNPPASLAEAIDRIEVKTKIKRSARSVRDFMKKHLKFRYRKVGAIPAKADPEKQEQFLHKELNPRLKEAKQGKRVVLFYGCCSFCSYGYFRFPLVKSKNICALPQWKKKA